MTITLSITEIIAILGLGFTVASAFASILWVIWRRVELYHKQSIDSDAKNKEVLEAQDRMIQTDVAAFKLQVAQQYATWSQIKDLEGKWLQETERLHSAVTNLTSRIDRVITRMEKL